VKEAHGRPVATIPTLAGKPPFPSAAGIKIIPSTPCTGCPNISKCLLEHNRLHLQTYLNPHLAVIGHEFEIFLRAMQVLDDM
jgi:hypothetical protein